MNIVFFGSDDFAVVNLQKIFKSSHKLVACVTPPDRPRGRHLKFTPSVVKEAALAAKVPVLQPDDLKGPTFLKELAAFGADVVVVIAYGRILPREVLDLPGKFCVNMHGSLLPKYRGAAPINWAIINGEEITGVSAIRMNAGMDAGDVIAQEKIRIDPDDTAETLRSKMAELSGQLLIRVLDLIQAGTCSFKKQDEKEVSHAPKLTKDLGLIDWTKDADEICRLVRGLLPWPCAYTYFNEKVLKIMAADPGQLDKGKHCSGEIVSVAKEMIAVCAGKGCVFLRSIRPEGSKSMTAAGFLAGHQLQKGFRFGST